MPIFMIPVSLDITVHLYLEDQLNPQIVHFSEHVMF